MSEQNRIPQHVAIIMDGNGRWAELRGKERYEGHVAGVEPVRASLRAAARWGVKYLTLYAFSTENWGRPTHEVDALMELFCKSVVNETPELIREPVRTRKQKEPSGSFFIDRIYPPGSLNPKKTPALYRVKPGVRSETRSTLTSHSERGKDQSAFPAGGHQGDSQSRRARRGPRWRGATEFPSLYPSGPLAA